jgi:TonB-linked SusC/RagA family outer membrane protein
MIHIPRWGPLPSFSMVAAFVVLLAGPALAQETVITGRVTSDQGNPLGGASITVANTSISAATAEDGTYRLVIPAGAIRGAEATLTVRFIGRRPAVQRVPLEPGTQTVNFQLAADPFLLDAVVVTGTAGAMEARKLSFAVASVSAEQLQEVPGMSALQGIQGKVAGARLVPTTAQPGGDVAVRLRGATSIGGRQDPLMIVDGVISRFGLGDIASQDVERVEVIKGAAASSLYGANAANGVIQVFTKRGRNLAEGELRVTLRTEGGMNQMPSRLEFAQSHYYEVDGTSGNCAANGWTVDPVSSALDAAQAYCLGGSGGRVTKGNQVADNRFPVYYDAWDALVKTGNFYTGYVSVGQRRGTTNFNVSFEHTRNQGVIYELGGFTRENFRINLDQQLRPNLTGAFSAFYGTSTNGRTDDGQTSPFFGVMFVQPDFNLREPDSLWTYQCTVPLSGDIANDFNPLCELANIKQTRDRNRFSGSGRLRWQPLEWLTAEGAFAYDQESQSRKDYTPLGYPTSVGTPTDGFLFRQSINNHLYNGNVTLTGRWTFGDIVNTTRASANMENQQNLLHQSNSGTLIVARVPEFAGTDPSTQRAESNEETIRNRSYLLISTFDIKDRYILDGLVRTDASSVFGPDSRWSTYYRASAAWRVSEDVSIPGIDEFKLRGSYGTAGLRPEFDYQYQILAVTAGGFSKQVLGNPDLKPARSGELELGTNLEFGNGLFNLEYNYSQKTTKDQILLVDLPAATGYSDGQWQNTGALRARTHELAFGARLINSRNTSLMLNIVGDRTRQVINEWDIPARQYAFQQMPTTFFLGEGSDLGVMHGNLWITDIDQLYDDPAKVNDPAWSRDSVMVNEDGYVVRRSAYGTLSESAIKYVTCKREDASGNCLETTNVVQIGDANPDFNLSFNLTLSVNRFTINGLLDWQKGGQLYNGTRQWSFQATRDRDQDQAGKPANDATCGTISDPMPSCPRKAAGYYAVGFYNGLDPSSYFVEPGSYAKLKELSVGYTFMSDQLQRIGLGAIEQLKLGFIGRNVFTITDYSGLDPEVSGVFGDPFQIKMDWFQYPQFRQFSTVVEITF